MDYVWRVHEIYAPIFQSLKTVLDDNDKPLPLLNLQN